MRRIHPIISLLLLLAFVSCSKNDNSPSTAISGTWISTNQVTLSYPYPTVLTNPYQIGYTSQSTSTDSVKVTFDNSGKYSFSNFRLTDDKGSYSIVRDSLLIIKPDTSDFVKFNYTLPTLSFGTGTVIIPPQPYLGFQFTSDTILFTRTNNNSITFKGAWLAKAERPIIPSGDTIILNEVFNYFKKE